MTWHPHPLCDPASAGLGVSAADDTQQEGTKQDDWSVCDPRSVYEILLDQSNDFATGIAGVVVGGSALACRAAWLHSLCWSQRSPGCMCRDWPAFHVTCMYVPTHVQCSPPVQQLITARHCFAPPSCPPSTHSP
jgi:hypothetical protein